MMVVYCHSRASALEHLPQATLSTSGCRDFLEAHSSTITTPFMSNIVLQSESLCYESLIGLLKEQFTQTIVSVHSSFVVYTTFLELSEQNSIAAFF